MKFLPRWTRAVLPGIACAILLLACSDSAPPTTPAPLVEAITIDGARSLAEGETLTLVATVRWAGGRTEVVTDGVTWSSEDPRIVSVNERGVVTAVGPGDGRIRATYKTSSGTTAVTVVAGARSITGRVHESWPTEDIRIGGATVIGIDSSGNTQSAVTDGSGHFTMRLARGVARIIVAAAGYETATTSVELGGASDGELLLPLLPVRREIRLTFPYVLPPPSTFPEQRSYRLAVHHSGELRAMYSNSYESASAQAFTRLEIRDANNHVLAHSRGSYDIPAAPIRLQVEPGIYEVKFFVSDPVGVHPPRVSLAGFAGEIKHPS